MDNEDANHVVGGDVTTTEETSGETTSAEETDPVVDDGQESADTETAGSHSSGDVDLVPTYPAKGSLLVAPAGPLESDLLQARDYTVHYSTLNPWRTLGLYDPRRKETTASGPYFPIHRLPFELVCEVAAHLPASSASSFALCSRRVYMALGEQYFTMKSNITRWQFLLLIEPELQASFACIVCQKLHRPAITRTKGPASCSRRMASEENIDGLPSSITSGLVHMIGRKHLEDPRACQEYLSWASMSERKTMRDTKLTKRVSPRMIDGNLFIKTETYVHPFHKNTLTHRSLYELIYLLGGCHYDGTLRSICAHKSWDEELVVAEPLEEYFCKAATMCEPDIECGSYDIHYPDCFDEEAILDKLKPGMLSRMMECLLLHDQPCHMKSGSSRRQSPPGGKVQGCKTCVTNYCISACDVSGVGRCLVFTSWVDVGGVRPGEAGKWDTFLGRGELREPERSYIGENTMWKPPSTPETYLTFENAKASIHESNSRAKSGVPRYLPTPDWKTTRDLTQLVKGHYGIYGRPRSDDDDYLEVVSDSDFHSGDSGEDDSDDTSSSPA